MPQGWTPVAESSNGWTPVEPTYRVENEKDVQGNAVVDPNTVGTFARHVGQQLNPVPLGQMIPFPKAAGGAGMDAPRQVVQGFADQQHRLLTQAKQAVREGDYVTAGEKALTWALNYPTLGLANQLDKAGTELQQGKYAAAGGDVVGLLTAAFGPVALSKMKIKTPAVMKNPNAVEAEAARFGQARGVPVDAAMATGNRAVQGVQYLADRSLAGSLGATGRNQRTAKAIERVGGELADQAHPTAATPDQAGANIGDVLQAKSQRHADQADVLYGRLRALERQKTHQLDVPLPPQLVDLLEPGQVGQLRRIVHELDAMPYSKRLLQPTAKGGSLEHVPGTGGAGARVFDDIKGYLEEGDPSRGAVQSQLEAYLAGGKETGVVKAALKVAEERAKGRGRPELGPDAMEMPTAQEASRVKFQTMGLPVHMAPVKDALRSIERQMSRQLPVTQQQANPGLHAIRQILDGPEWAPLSQADRDLSAIKRLGRESGGIAKLAVSQLEAAVTKAAAQGSPEVLKTLKQARQAVVAKYGTADVLERVTKGTAGEPVRAWKRMVAPKDSGIDLLRSVAKETPQALPQVGRAFLDDLFEQAKAEGGFLKTDKLQAEWQKLGPETKTILFPDAAHRSDLNNFFLLAKKLNLNPNPSGTAGVGSLAAQGTALGGALASMPLVGPVPIIVGIMGQLGAAGLSAFLHSPKGVKVLTQGVSLSLGKAPRALQAATAARIADQARTLGLDLAPAGAVGGPERRESTPSGAGR